MDRYSHIHYVTIVFENGHELKVEEEWILLEECPAKYHKDVPCYGWSTEEIQRKYEESCLQDLGQRNPGDWTGFLG